MIGSTSIPIPIQITPVHLWIVFAIISIIAVVMCVILFFHWRNYGFKSRYAVIAESVFIGVTLAILCLALGSIIYFSTV